MLADFPEKVPLIESARLLTRDWVQWMRSLLLAVNGLSDTWAPIDASGAGLTFTNTSGNCSYLKVGSVVQATFRVTYPATASGADALIGGLPFTAKNTTASVYGGVISSTDETTAARVLVTTNATTFAVLTSAGGAVTNATLSGNDLRGTVTYTAAS